MTTVRATPATGLEDARRARVGVVSDTHDQVRPSLLALFRDVDLILHGGDVTRQRVLDELASLAPVLAVRGNNDPESLGLPLSLELVIGGCRVAVAHGDRFPLRAKRAALAAAFRGADLVVYGHTHRAAREDFGGTLVVNPGSAGPRRFGAPLAASAAILEVRQGKLEWLMHDLD